MAYFTTSAAIGNNAVTKIRDDLDAGSGPGCGKWYSGTQPSGLGALSGNTLLGTTVCSDPCGTVSGRTLTITAPSADTAADDNGAPSFVRFEDSNGNAVFDIPVMTVAAYNALSADQKTLAGIVVTVNTSPFVAGGPISWSGAIVITDPNG